MSTSVTWTPVTNRRIRPMVAAAASGLLLALTAGCPQFGAVLYHMGFGPNKDVEAKFQFPAGSVVILVDDDMDLVQPTLAREVLVDQLATEFARNEIAERVTRNDELARVRQASGNFERMPVREVGRRVNADTVLWLSVEDFFIEDDLSITVKDARFAVKLKVFDVHEESLRKIRLWPPGREGKRVSATLSAHEVRACRNRAEVHRKLAAALADRIARLFYSYTIER